PTTRKGEIMLAAISRPPLTADANRHAPAASHPGRALAAANAAPTAATANRPGSAAGDIGSPPSSAASAAKAVPSTRARPRTRRTQPRAAVYGPPARSAPGRPPQRPPATRAITEPIVSTWSSRHARTNAGNSAWVTAHGPHRSRGTKILQQRSAARSQRRYPDQNTSGPAHAGHGGRGNSTSRPAAT